MYRNKKWGKYEYKTQIHHTLQLHDELHHQFMLREFILIYKYQMCTWIFEFLIELFSHHKSFLFYEIKDWKKSEWLCYLWYMF